MWGNDIGDMAAPNKKVLRSFQIIPWSGHDTYGHGPKFGACWNLSSKAFLWNTVHSMVPTCSKYASVIVIPVVKPWFSWWDSCYIRLSWWSRATCFCCIRFQLYNAKILYDAHLPLLTHSISIFSIQNIENMFYSSCLDLWGWCCPTFSPCVSWRWPWKQGNSWCKRGATGIRRK